MSSGRTDIEIITEIEAYYYQLCLNCDQEVLRLREELCQVEAENRSNLAEDLIVPQAELDNLSNFFLDCIYAQRKSLRQKLIKIKVSDSSNSTSADGSLQGKKNKLLENYLRIVKTGAPEEIEQFSKIER